MAAKEQTVAVERLNTAVTELMEERSRLEPANFGLQGEVNALSLSGSYSGEKRLG